MISIVAWLSWLALTTAMLVVLVWMSRSRTTAPERERRRPRLHAQTNLE
jgi:hypothetical protein